MRNTLVAALAGAVFIATPIVATFGAIAFVAPAIAHEGHEHSGHEGHAQAAALSHERVVEIAIEQGVATVEEMELENGVWEVEGRTVEGQRIEIEISAETGAVVKRELY